MSTELMIPEQTSVVANTTAELPSLQAPLKMWAQKRLDEARAEYGELDAAATKAKQQRWNHTAIRRAANNAIGRITFYEKVVGALEAGYMLFPPVPNADVIALRCGTAEVGDNARDTRNVAWEQPRHAVTMDKNPLPLGEGEYFHPVPKWIKVQAYKTEKGEERCQWQALDLEAPQFPLMMAKPEIIEATSAAMELKLFDEIRMFPFTRRKGDPCLLGAIVEKGTGRRHYFLISWRIDAKDI